MPAIVDQEDKVFRRLFTRSTELKRLANKAADLQYSPCVRNHLLAISACQNHSYIGPGFRGFHNQNSNTLRWKCWLLSVRARAAGCPSRSFSTWQQYVCPGALVWLACQNDYPAETPNNQVDDSEP